MHIVSGCVTRIATALNYQCGPPRYILKFCGVYATPPNSNMAKTTHALAKKFMTHIFFFLVNHRWHGGHGQALWWGRVCLEGLSRVISNGVTPSLSMNKCHKKTWLLSTCVQERSHPDCEDQVCLEWVDHSRSERSCTNSRCMCKLQRALRKQKSFSAWNVKSEIINWHDSKISCFGPKWQRNQQNFSSRDQSPPPPPHRIVCFYRSVDI